MAPSPFRSRLYRRLGQAVIWGALALLVAQNFSGQVARKGKVKGPRATGLIELAANGKAHLIPITIMVDGRFYDASAYKANPVPFALESEVVYQAMRTGVPQGEFTVTGALQSQDTWFGEGKWVAGGSKPKKTHAAEAKPNLDDDSGPPTLRKAGSKGAKPPESAPAPSSAPAPAPTPAPAPMPSNSGHGSADPQSSESSPAQAAKPSAEDSSESANDQDPNRPSLRRGKQAPAASTTPPGSSTAPSSTSAAAHSVSKPKESAKSTGPVQLIPAVSDAGGPEPRPYAFDMKSEEEEGYRKKLMVLATAEVLSKAKQMTPVMPTAAPPKKTSAKPATKGSQPVFDTIQFRAFDLSNTNEPVFVLSAQAHLPASSSASPKTDPSTYFITLVAKADIYLDLHKLLAQVTDEHHLDEFPRFELIDAVDADGDGRGELLFREISDQGTAWAVYRAAADRLYPLFEGKPQQPHPHPVSER